MTDSAAGLEIGNLRIGGNTYQESGDVTDEEENVIGTAPSIDYPSEIKRVAGDVEVGVSGKNLIKFAKEDWIGGYFNGDGTVNGWGGTADGLIDSKYYTIPNGFNEVVLSFMPLKDFKLGRYYTSYYDENKNPISGITSFADASVVRGGKFIRKIINNIPQNAKYFRVAFKWIIINGETKINMYDELYQPRFICGNL